MKGAQKAKQDPNLEHVPNKLAGEHLHIFNSQSRTPHANNDGSESSSSCTLYVYYYFYYYYHLFACFSLLSA